MSEFFFEAKFLPLIWSFILKRKKRKKNYSKFDFHGTKF